MKYLHDYKRLGLEELQAKLYAAKDDLLFWLDKDDNEAKEYSERIEFLKYYITKRFVNHRTMSQTISILSDMGFKSEETFPDYWIMSYGSGPNKAVVSVGLDGLCDGTYTIAETLKDVGL